jgi:hypothetical protein
MALTPTTVGDGLLGGGDFRVGKSLQTAYGAINATPVFVPVRRRSGRPAKAVGYTQDETVTEGYQGQEQIQDTTDLTVSIEASATKQSIGFLVEAIYAAETIYTLTAATFAAVANGFTVPAAAYAALSVGDGFWVTGFAGSTINGFYIVGSKTGGTTIVTTVAPAATEAAGASVTLKSNKYVNANNAYYNAFQTRATDLSKVGSLDYHTLYDAVANTFSMEIGETGIITASSEYLAEREVAGTALISGQTYAAAATDRALSAVQSVQAFYVNELPATCKMKSMSLSVANNQQGDDAAGCSKRYTRGAFEVTGSTVVRSMKSNPFVWRDYYWNGTRVSCGVRVSHGNGDETYIVMSQLVVTESTMDDGNNAIANSQASFTAEGHAATNSTIRVYTNYAV